MSFITSPGVIVPPLTAGGVAYGTGSQAKVNSAGASGQVLRSSGAGVPVWATSTAGIPVTVAEGGTSLTTLTANNVILGNGTSAPTFVAPGTSGNVLSSNGTTWASTAAAPSALTFISSVVASSATTVDIENAFTAYQQYIIIGSAITTTSDFNIRVKIGGVYISTATYDYWSVGGYGGLAVPYVNQNINFTEIFAYGNGFATVANFYLTIGVKSGKKSFINFSVNGDTSSRVGTQNGAGANSSTGALEGIRIFGSTYTGTFRLYGVSNS